MFFNPEKRHPKASRSVDKKRFLAFFRQRILKRTIFDRFHCLLPTPQTGLPEFWMNDTGVANGQYLPQVLE
jgi:hypothetical protein